MTLNDTLPSIAGGRLPLRRILVVQTQRLGDVLIATPVIAALRKRFPSAEIDALVHSPWERILESNPDLTSALSYDRQGAQGSLRGRWALLRQLRRREYDWVLSIHAASTAALAIGLCGAKWRTCVWRYGDRKPPHWRRLFQQHVRQDRLAGETHEVQHNLNVLRTLGIPAGEERIRVAVTEAARETAAALLPPDDPLRPLALLHAGHGGGRQCWPEQHYAALASLLVDRGFRVGLTGGAGERELTAGIAGNAAVPVIDLAGRASLEQLPGILARGAVFVSVPTGPMHMAAGLGVPVVALYGPTDLRIDRTRFAPYATSCVKLESSLICSCPGSRTCRTPECLAAIRPDAVLDAVLKLVGPPAGAGATS